ncbi:MAG TPA: hypothetical protein VGQ83_26775 [Polyangia bacterium]|jgi:hypothetical protein
MTRPAESLPVRLVAGDGDADSQTPEIRVSEDEATVIKQALAALAGESMIYERAGLLVHVMRGATKATGAALRREHSAPRLAPVPLSWIELYLSRQARWRRFMGDQIGWQPVRPPTWAVRQVFDSPVYPGIRCLHGVTESPVMRRDGTIIDSPGFDDASGLLYLPAGEIGSIPDKPTKEDVAAALAALFDAVCDFPFEGEEHRAAWLASLLTLFARWSFDGPAPLFFFDANTPGAGKSKLSTITGIIGLGRAPDMMTWSSEPAESAKTITSLLLEGDPLVVIDNIEGSFGDANIKALLTLTTWKQRILGVNKTTGPLPNLTTWFATANNVQLKGKDMPRRLITIRLRSDLEHPEERLEFKHHPVEDFVHRERPRLAAAALTLLRAYAVAGRPDSHLPSGDYPGWCRAVRDAVVWLGLPNPTATRAALRATADSDTAEHRALVAVVDGVCKGRWLKTAEILESVKTEAELRERLLEHCYGKQPDELPDPKRFAHKLGKHRDAVVDGQRLVSETAHGGYATWRVERVSEVRP